MRTIYFTLVGLLVLAALIVPPIYPDPAAGAARFDTHRVESDRWRVAYAGSPSPHAADLRDLALLRAADVTREQGGDWFEIVTDEAARDRGSQTWLPESERDTGYALEIIIGHGERPRDSANVFDASETSADLGAQLDES